MDLKNKLLEILICPQCRHDLKVDENGAICEKCRVLYPFSDGTQGLLAENAISLESDEQVN